jgi:hypothetical protein
MTPVMSTSPTDASRSIACPIPRHRLAYRGVTRHLTYTFAMANEVTVLEEAMDNLKEAGQRIRATQSLMRSQGMTEGENYRDLLTRLSTALAMTEAAYLEARRRRDL